MIDSHCHLADKKFTEDIDAVIARARAAGVSPMVTIADSLEEAERCIALADQHPDIFCSVGTHPHNAKNWNTTSADMLRSLVKSSDKVKAIGEIGLDYHYDLSPRDVQKTVFRDQLMIAKELGLPAVIHCREAVDDLKSIIEEVAPPSLVIHCCTETWEDIEPLVTKGFLLSFTGIATYPNAPEIRDTIAHCPLSQMMIETDAPYLAPIPHRGKRNEPAFVVEVAKIIAEIKGISLAEVDRATTNNAVEFFGL